VSRAGESTVPGLYFVGAPAAVSNGPASRFIAGTHTMAAKVARSAARHQGTARGGPARGTAAPAADRAPRASGDAAVQEKV
jgi:hypothetical protein